MELKVINHSSLISSNKVGHSTRCGQGDSIPEHIKEKIKNHPCYSEQAHHYYARMHVAVAPSCNIQCNFCNRKYDCANESRPGVVSELLTPEQAVNKTLAVADAIPQMSVVGIAGPGDPLANPERTFSTFGELSKKAPDIKLCVSTNGLALPKYVDELVKHNIGHVTITINCVDASIGAKIYPWIFWNHRRIRGEKGAKILIEQQQKGLEMLVERDILVKVNSVMIPGINDQHLKEVSRIVKDKGAFLHNVMPLIAEPEHGTFFGVTGQRAPTHEELQNLQEACSSDMKMMRHCRQCRADAVGLLGEDRNAEFTLKKIEKKETDYRAAMEKRAKAHRDIEEKRKLKQSLNKFEKDSVSSGFIAGRDHHQAPLLVAVATQGEGLINQHFGHAKEFLIYEASAKGVRFLGYRKTEIYCTGPENCTDADTILDHTISILKGCKAVLCSKIGFEPWVKLEDAGIVPNGEHAMEPIEESIMQVYQELIQEEMMDRKLKIEQHLA